jgi:hypothetical protein
LNMQEYIPLAFGLEAIYPPMDLPVQRLRDLYVRLADPCRFSEFRHLGENSGARFSEGKNRSFHIARDRLVYRDDYTQCLFSTFTEDIQQILNRVRETLHIPVLLHNKVTVRLLMPYQSGENTVDFFQKNLLNNAVPHLSIFERPLSGVGIRFIFPPTPEQHSTFHLRIEPYFPDLKMFFIENNGQFFDPIVNVQDIKKYLDATYDFIKEKAGPFILSLNQDSQAGEF